MIEQRIEQLKSEIDFAESKLKNNLKSMDAETVIKTVYNQLPFANQDQNVYGGALGLVNNYVTQHRTNKLSPQSFILKHILKIIS